MKSTICHIIILFIFSAVCFGQSGSLSRQWDYSYGGEGGEFLTQIIPTQDGGFLVAGTSNSKISLEKQQENFDPNTATEDYWLVKCNADGLIEWTNTYGGSDNDFLYNVTLTSDGGYLLVGRTKSPLSGTVTQAPKGAGFDCWIVKISSTGNVEWDKRFGGNDNNGGGAAVQLADGGFLIAGNTNSDKGIDVSEAGFGAYDYWIIRTDKTGNKLWDKRYGSSGDDGLVSILHAPTGGFYLFGSSYSPAGGTKTMNNYTAGKSDMWIVEIDSLANFISDKIIGSLEDDFRIDAIETKNGNYVFAALTRSGIGADKTVGSEGVDDFWVIKVDGKLNILWDVAIGGNLDECSGPNLFETADSSYLISGTTYSAAGNWKTESNIGPENTWAVKFDKLGNKIWDKTVLTGYSHDESGLIAELKDGCVVVANNGDAMVGNEKTDQSMSFDFWVIKYCEVPPVAAFMADDTIICENSYVNFTDTSLGSPTSWQWQFPGGEPTNSTIQNPKNILYKKSGQYPVYLKVTNRAGKDSIVKQGYINVITAPFVNLGKDTTLCEGQTLALDAGDAKTYKWNTGENTKSIQINKSGKYWAEITNNEGCKNSDTIEIQYEKLPLVNLGSDRVLCKGNAILLLAPKAQTYLWQDGTTSSTLYVDKPGTYSVEVSNGLCKGKDEINILPCAEEFNPSDTVTSFLYFPNAFSPNNDGYNDVLAPVSYNLLNYELHIYNRWGELIFHTQNAKDAWNGTFKNKPVPEGAYLAIVYALGADATKYNLSQLIYLVY